MNSCHTGHMPKKPEVYSAIASGEERNAPLISNFPNQAQPSPGQGGMQVNMQQRLPGQPENVSQEDFLAALARQAQAVKESAQGGPERMAQPAVWPNMKQQQQGQGQLVDPMAPQVNDPIPLRGRGQYMKPPGY